MKSTFYRAIAWLASFPATWWASYHEKRISQHGRKLTAIEIEFAQQIGVVLTDDVFIQAVPYVPNPLRIASAALDRCFSFKLMQPVGITLGHGIYVVNGSESKRLIQHELVHVLQYERATSTRAFMLEYLHQCLLHGYHDAPWEQEAREVSGH